MIAIAIFTLGCGAKDESTADTKPVEEKAVEVKEEVKLNTKNIIYKFYNI